MGGLVNSAFGLTAGAEATDAAAPGTDKGLAAAGEAAGLVGLPAQLMNMAGIGTDVAIGGMVTGDTMAAGGVAAAAGGAAAVGSVASAGLAGYGVGTLAAQGIDKYGTDSAFGQKDDGTNKSVFDVASDAGHSVDGAVTGALSGVLGDSVGSGIGTVAGAATAGIGSILAAPVGAAAALTNGISSLFGGSSDAGAADVPANTNAA